MTESRTERTPRTHAARNSGMLEALEADHPGMHMTDSLELDDDVEHSNRSTSASGKVRASCIR
jgi:hypothetical protein